MAVKKRILKILLFTTAIILLLISLAGIGFSLFIAKNMHIEIDDALFSSLSGDTASEIYYYQKEYDSSGNISHISEMKLEGAELYGGYKSEYKEYEEMPSNLIYAFIAIEDKRFFSHNGVDLRRTLSAGINYIARREKSFGGSTITQQLIKNVTGRDEYTFGRKLQEILWALDLERKFTKTEILEGYLNIINLAGGCYGVGAASRHYFSKDVSELTLEECATIAAITNSPSRYDPQKNPENNIARRNLILGEMYKQGYIDKEAYEDACQAPLLLKESSYGEEHTNSWYVDMVIEDVIEDLCTQKGVSREYATMMLYRGGLKIYTAMDVNVQRILEEYYGDIENFKVKDKQGLSEEHPQSAMIVIHPYSGDILGVAGAVGEKQGNRIQNFATDTRRPAGSVIKPLSVYAPALDAGIISWSSVYDDVPIEFVRRSEDEEYRMWPKNANGIYRGLTNVNYALEHSVNTVAVRVLDDLGLENSFEFLRNDLHFSSLQNTKEASGGKSVGDVNRAALALGQFNYGVTLREVSAAYSIFPNMGVYNDTRSYYKVTDRTGSSILSKDYWGDRVISQESAVIMTRMLENVVHSGTASSISLKSEVACAGKTGTTQGSCDRWYIGYTPRFIGGVWYGYEYPKELTGDTHICTRIWDEIIGRLEHLVVGKSVKKSFSELNGIDDNENIVQCEFCTDSGMLATQACKKDPRGERTETGYFLKGSEPTQGCDRHVLVAYDKKEGGVASHNCSFFDVEYVSLIRVERSFPTQVIITDAQYTCRQLDDEILPETDPYLPFYNNAVKSGYCGISGGLEFNRYCRAHFDYYRWIREGYEKQRNVSATP